MLNLPAGSWKTTVWLDICGSVTLLTAPPNQVTLYNYQITLYNLWCAVVWLWVACMNIESLQLNYGKLWKVC